MEDRRKAKSNIDLYKTLNTQIKNNAMKLRNNGSTNSAKR